MELRGGNCYPKEVLGVNVGLACVDGVISFLAFYQLMRIHSRNLRLGWTRQKVFHLLIGSSSLGYFLYFVLTLVAACKGWICWSHSCGFIFMAFPKILFVAAFLLLLSFWVDLCHQSNNDDEDEGCSPREALLERRNITDSNIINLRICFSFRSIRIGSRQKVVILVAVLVFATMIASSVLIWIGMGKNPISSAVVAQIYVDVIARRSLGMLWSCIVLKNAKSEVRTGFIRNVEGCGFGHCLCCMFYIKCCCDYSNKHTPVLSLAWKTDCWCLHLSSTGCVLFHRIISALCVCPIGYE